MKIILSKQLLSEVLIPSEIYLIVEGYCSTYYIRKQHNLLEPVLKIIDKNI